MRRFALVCISVLACFALFGCDSKAPLDPAITQSHFKASEYTTRDRWAVNEYGLSYGSAESVVYKPGSTTVQLMDYYPDLIYAIATNGASGYMWSAEYLSCKPSGYSTIIESLVKKGSFVVDIPVYKADGAT